MARKMENTGIARIMPPRLYSRVIGVALLAYSQGGGAAHVSDICDRMEHCDPTAGTAIVGELTASGLSVYYNRRPAKSLTNVAPSDGKTCPANMECATYLNVAQCLPCTMGKHCPAGTSNPISSTAYNLCPQGYSCSRPDRIERCKPGKFCPFATVDGGQECPEEMVLPYAKFLKWGVALSCPGGNHQPGICGQPDGGTFCDNVTHSRPCPSGSWCPVGGNASVRCSTDWFGNTTAEERCPEGSVSDQPVKAWIALVFLILLPTLLLCEMCGRVDRVLRKARKTSRHAYDGDEQLEKARAASVVAGYEQPTDMQGNAFLHQFAAYAQTPGSFEGTVPASSPRDSSANRNTKKGFRFGGWSSRMSQGDKTSTNAEASGIASDEIADRYTPTVSENKGRMFVKLQMKNGTFKINKARVLQDLNFHMMHGELVALMGESGSGKSTLLNILGGRADYGRLSGEMTLNGRRFDPHASRHLVGFVPQAHIVYKELTVYENLAYAAELRLHRPASLQKREQLVEKSLELLGLEECRHFVCDPSIGERLSGGQMRRIGIGIELVCDPPIMLLDEPTSALDAVNTRLVVASLKGLARRGVLLIASIHQPRQAVYNMLDRLLLLRKGGLIYGGLIADSRAYFDTVLGYRMPSDANPADFLIEVAFGYEKSKKPLGDILVPYQVARKDKLATSSLVEQDSFLEEDSARGHVDTEDSSIDPSTMNVPELGTVKNHPIERLKSRLPLVPERRLQQALDVADGNDGWAYTLLLSPTTFDGDTRSSLGTKKCRTSKEQKTVFQEMYHQTPGDWCPAALSNEEIPDVLFTAALNEVKTRWTAIHKTKRSILGGVQRTLEVNVKETYHSIVKQLSDIAPTGRVAKLPDELIREASAENAEALAQQGRGARMVEATDLKYVWLQWYTLGMTHADLIMDWLHAKQAREVRRANLLATVVKSFIARYRGDKAPGLQRSVGSVIRKSISRSISKVSGPASGMGDERRARGSVAKVVGHQKADRGVIVHRHDDEGATLAAQLGRICVDVEGPVASASSSSAAPPSPPPSPPESNDALQLQRSKDSLVRIRKSKEKEKERDLLHSGVSLEEFKRWFSKHRNLGRMLQDELAEEVWHTADKIGADVKHFNPFHSDIGVVKEHQHDKDVQMNPSWSQLRTTMETWHMPKGEMPGWRVSFSVAFRRYLLKLLRKRMGAWTLVLVVTGLGLLCGSMHGTNPSRNDLMIFYLLFNSMFASAVATSTIQSLGGQGEDLAFLQHEASSGVPQTAEALARLLIDVFWPLSLLPIAFAFPLKGLSTIALSMRDLWLHWWLLSFAVSPIGYFFALLVPSNAVTLTSTVTLLTCAFGTGAFGITAKALPPITCSVLPWLSPGAPALMRIALGSALSMPFGEPRAFMLVQLRELGMFSSMMGLARNLTAENEDFLRADEIVSPGPTMLRVGETSDYIFGIELGHNRWADRTAVQLITFGLVLRVVVLLLFHWRNTGFVARMRVYLRKRLKCKRSKRGAKPVTGTLHRTLSKA